MSRFPVSQPKRNTYPPATDTPTKQDLEWAAGFWEGEGNVFVRGGCLRINAVQCDPTPLFEFQRVFGGKVFPRSSPTHRRREIFVWQAFGPRALGVAYTLFSLVRGFEKQQQLYDALRDIQNLSRKAPWSAKTGGTQ